MIAARLAVLALAILACGGRIATEDRVPTDSSTPVPDSGPLIDGGLVTGSCHLDVGFTLKGMPYHPVTQADVQSTAARAGGAFELVCSGKAPNNYHYIFDAKSIGLTAGPHDVMAELVEDPDTHNPQVADGPCTITVTSFADNTVSGTFDCAYLLDDPIGGYAVKGSFVAPLH